MAGIVCYYLVFLSFYITSSMANTTTIKSMNATTFKPAAVVNPKLPHAKLIAREGLALNPAQQNIVDDMSWPVKIMFYKELLTSTSKPAPLKPLRRVGIEQLVLKSRDGVADEDWDESSEEKSSSSTKNTKIELSSDDTQIKLKLFTLMDETARDCDLKVRRADLIKAHYKNNTAFDVGLLMGSISDKHRHMTDTATTLRRLYNEWKPIEHINAYEQIANQAIEISHLIETAKHSIQKLESEDTSSKPRII